MLECNVRLLQEKCVSISGHFHTEQERGGIMHPSDSFYRTLLIFVPSLFPTFGSIAVNSKVCLCISCYLLQFSSNKSNNAIHWSHTDTI